MATAAPDVMIAGAGPVGLAAALELRRLGFAVRIIERRGWREPYSKALGINSRTLELLEPLGVTRSLLERGHAARRAALRWHEQLLGRVEFGGAGHPFSLMLVLPQYETEVLLENRLQNFGCTVEYATELVEAAEGVGGVHCTLRGPQGQETASCGWLLGADGARSRVRERLGLRLRGGPAQPWSLADIVADLPLPGGEPQIMLRADGVCFALGYRPRQWRVAADAPGVLDRLPAGSAVHRVLWYSDFQVAQRRVTTPGQGRIWLAGDAAHLHSPLGARGMNLGIEDAIEFARLLQLGRVADYGRRRAAAARSTLRQVGRMTAFARAVPVRGCQRRLLPPLLALEPVQRVLRRRMLGLSAAPVPDPLRGRADRSRSDAR